MHLFLLSQAFFSAAVFFTAVLLDLVFGDPPTTIHPVGWQGRFISILWKQKPDGGKCRLFFFGLFIVSSGIVITFGIVILIHLGIKQLSIYKESIPGFVIIVILNSFLLKGSFSFRNLLRAGDRVAAALSDGDMDKARYQVSYHLVSRPVDSLDASAVASAALESLSENFTDSVAAPFFWYALGGPAASWCYRYVNTADAMLGYREGDREWGGKAAARLDDVLSWVPARFAGWMICAAAVLPRLDARGAVRTMRHDARNCSSPNSGWSMAAAAGALGVRFEKIDNYVINDGGRRPEGEDIKGLKRLLHWSLVFSLPPVILLNALVLSLIQRTFNLPAL
ncbi:MAG: cobalamin biosynthesis protein CobD [Spirochaetes bacterium]|nr:MAG: cobalamin biosynthesis protein CobD [Spirochaetota bacterium]